MRQIRDQKLYIKGSLEKGLQRFICPILKGHRYKKRTREPEVRTIIPASLRELYTNEEKLKLYSVLEVYRNVTEDAMREEKLETSPRIIAKQHVLLKKRRIG